MSGPIVFTYGRFNPPHKGHEMMIQQIINTAKNVKGTPVIIVSHTQNTKGPPRNLEKNKNPLSVNNKLSILRKMFPKEMFPNVIFKHSSKNIQLKNMVPNFGNNWIMFHGNNRFKKKTGQSGFAYLLGNKPYNNKRFKTSGNRDPNAEGQNITGASATAVRRAAAAGNVNKVKGMMSSKLKNENIRAITKKIKNLYNPASPTTTPTAKRARRTPKRSPQ
jgi:predicted nucleotidyltransferase